MQGWLNAVYKMIFGGFSFGKWKDNNLEKIVRFKRRLIKSVWEIVKKMGIQSDGINSNKLGIELLARKKYTETISQTERKQ